MNIKKFLITIIFTIIAIIGINTQAKAVYDYSQSKTYNINDQVFITFSDYEGNKNLLCFQHGQSLLNEGRVYRVVSIVNIDGTKSTDHAGKTIDSWYNAKMAYIATSSDTKDNKKNAIWKFAPEWMRKVGRNHKGLGMGFSKGNLPEYIPTNLIKKAEKYADSIKDGLEKPKDNTTQSKIKKTIKTVDGKQYIVTGPFNWTFSGELKNVKVYNQNNKQISGVSYATYKGKDLVKKEISEIKSKKSFYILIPVDKGVTKLTKIEATSTAEILKARLEFLQPIDVSWQNLVKVSGSKYSKPLNSEFEYNITFLGNLEVIKVDNKNQTVKLKDVSFIIKNKDTDKYVKRDNNGNITYVAKDQATEFITNENGEILIQNLIYGNYTAYETKNPNYGYDILDKGIDTNVVVDKTKQLKITNEQKLIKLSGYVWEDKISEKQSIRNNLYKDNPSYDSNDKLMQGITVRLKDKSGNIVKNAKGQECTTKTNANGAYLFEDISVAELENYYVEFEYDGMTYTNVTPHTDKDNGSKAAEHTNVRDAFNNAFASIEGTSETAGISKDVNGNITHNLSYNRNKESYTSTFINDGSYIITSNTNATEFNIKNKYKPGMEIIENINLGLYEREQPDLAVVKDVENAKLTINGFAHTYQYANRFNNAGEYGEGFNVGVKFGEKYGSMSYSRAIYKSDLDYTTENKENELKVYITYAIGIKNQTTNLKERANTIIDYYDSRYQIVNIGTGMDEKSNITGSLKYTDNSYNDSYKKATITLNDFIEAGNTQKIYVQFLLSKEAVLQIINDRETLQNVTEIASYSVQDKNGKAYAGIEIDSNPANAIPGDKTTYEDDTDSAPSLKLEVADARTMTGVVFLDTTQGDLATAKLREGDGEYKAGEKGIKDVDIKLTENSASGKVYTAKTREDGQFIIEGYIPGNYTLTYTWGNEEYKVEDFKGTIYKDKDRANNAEWYKTLEPRYSDAIDNWETRKQIDKVDTNITKMDSSTPTMKVGIEYETTYSAPLEDGLSYGTSKGDKFIYEIKYIDFGIAERARQELTLDKTVKTMKITLPNGQTIVDAKINEQGKLEGQIEGVTGGPSLGFVKAELDAELIQGSTLEIGYAITVKNISELDYVSEDGYYYTYGYEQAVKANKLGNVLKLNVKEMRDYLDNTLAFNETDGSIWTVKSSDQEGKTLLTTTELSKKDLAPSEYTSVTMNSSKILSNKEVNIFNNEAKISKVSRTPEISTDTPYGRKPNLPKDLAEQVIVNLPTGESQNYILLITIGIGTLIALGVGVVIIKKKVIK